MRVIVEHVGVMKMCPTVAATIFDALGIIA